MRHGGHPNGVVENNAEREMRTNPHPLRHSIGWGRARFEVCHYTRLNRTNLGNTGSTHMWEMESRSCLTHSLMPRILDSRGRLRVAAPKPCGTRSPGRRSDRKSLWRVQSSVWANDTSNLNPRSTIYRVRQTLWGTARTPASNCISGFP